MLFRLRHLAEPFHLYKEPSSIFENHVNYALEILYRAGIRNDSHPTVKAAALYLVDDYLRCAMGLKSTGQIPLLGQMVMVVEDPVIKPIENMFKAAASETMSYQVITGQPGPARKILLRKIPDFVQVLLAYSGSILVKNDLLAEKAQNGLSLFFIETFEKRQTRENIMPAVALLANGVRHDLDRKPREKSTDDLLWVPWTDGDESICHEFGEERPPRAEDTLSDF